MFTAQAWQAVARCPSQVIFFWNPLSSGCFEGLVAYLLKWSSKAAMSSHPPPPHFHQGNKNLRRPVGGLESHKRTECYTDIQPQVQSQVPVEQWLYAFVLQLPGFVLLSVLSDFVCDISSCLIEFQMDQRTNMPRDTNTLCECLICIFRQTNVCVQRGHLCTRSCSFFLLNSMVSLYPVTGEWSS